MQTRREIIRTLTAGVAASAIRPAEAQPSTREVCLKEAGQLAETMRKLAGGQWRVTVDKNLEFVLVSKIL
jgi:cytochrome c556